MPTAVKLSTKTPLSPLLPGDRIVAVRRAQDESDPAKRVFPATLAAVATAIGAQLPGPFRALSATDFQALLTAQQLNGGVTYYIHSRQAGGLPLPDVSVKATDANGVQEQDAYTVEPLQSGTVRRAVAYNPYADTTAPRAVPAELTTNTLRGGPKLVDYLTPFAGMAPYQVALSQMPLSGLAIGTRAFVQNPTAAPASGAIVPAAYYVLARCAPTDPLAVSAFVNGGGGAVTLQTPAKWVAENSAEGQAAFFALFDPNGRTGTNDYPTDYVVKYVENGRLGTYEATQYLAPAAFGGSIPAPGGTTNAYWRPYAPAVAGQTPYLSLTLAAAQNLAADPDSIQAILYHVLRGTAGDVLLQGVPSRAGATAADASIPGGFSPVGVWCDPVAAKYVLVDYDVASNVVKVRGNFTTETAGGNLVTQPSTATGNTIGEGADPGATLVGNSIDTTGSGNKIGANAAAGESLSKNSISGAGAFGNTISGTSADNSIGGSKTAFNILVDCTACQLLFCSGVEINGSANLTFIGCTAAVNSLPGYTSGPALFINNVLYTGGGGTDPLKANLASPTFTGTVRVPNATGADNAMAYGQRLLIGTTAGTAGDGAVVAAKQDKALTGYAIATGTPPALAPATDTVLTGLGKLENRAVANAAAAATNATNIATNTTAISNEVTARTTADNLKADKALTGYALPTGTPPAIAPATDTVLTGLGKLENRANANAATATTNAGNITTLQGQATTNAANIAANTAKIGTATLATAATDLSAALNEIRNTLPGTAERTAYTLALTDAGNLVPVNSGSMATVTIPPNSAVAFPLGTVINLSQVGAGQILIAAGAGVTLRQADGQLKSAKQWAELSLRKRGTDEWVLTGYTAA